MGRAQFKGENGALILLVLTVDFFLQRQIVHNRWIFVSLLLNTDMFLLILKKCGSAWRVAKKACYRLLHVNLGAILGPGSSFRTALLSFMP